MALLQQNQHYRQTARRWADFKKFATLKFTRRRKKWTGQTVLAYFAFIGKRSNQPKVHLKHCQATETCNCPQLHRPNTLLNVRTAICNGFRMAGCEPNPANDFLVDSFLTTVRKCSDVSRVYEKQAEPISRSKAADVAARLEMTAYTKPDTLFSVTHLRNAALIRLMSYTGARAVDILNLQWKDVVHDKATGFITVSIRVGKTATVKKPWVHHLDPKAEGRLLQALIILGRETSKFSKINGYVFRTYTGSMKNPSAPLSTSQLMTLVKDNFGKEYSTHSFRVAKAIGLKQLGLTWGGVAAGLGATPTTAERYTRNSEKITEIMY